MGKTLTVGTSEKKSRRSPDRAGRMQRRSVREESGPSREELLVLEAEEAQENEAGEEEQYAEEQYDDPQYGERFAVPPFEDVTYIGDSLTLLGYDMEQYPILDPVGEMFYGMMAGYADGPLKKRGRDTLILCNMRYVWKRARRHKTNDYKYEDAVQDGFLGLIKAAEKYEAKKGFRFTTYATWWIDQAIMRRKADTSRTIRLPVHINETMTKIDRVEKGFIGENGEATTKDIAEALNISEQKVEEVRRACVHTIPLDSPLRTDEDQETLIGDMVADDADTEEEAVIRVRRDMLNKELDCLSERQRKVIILRYGLADRQFRTLDEVSKYFNVTRERIRQIESAALKTLRLPEHMEKLKGLL